METVSNNEISKEQIKLNLAINYMVIERVLRCMGIYNTVCDVHEGLDGEDGIFASARNRSLLDKLVNLDKEGVEVYLEEYQKLFGLSYAVLLGQEQIRLGIGIGDMGIPEKYKELHYADMNTLTNTVLDIANGLYGLQTILLDSIENEKQIKLVNDSLHNGIGNVNVNDDNTKILKQLQYNPLGINMYGLFAEIYLDKKLNSAIDTERIQDLLQPKNPIKDGTKTDKEYRLECEAYEKVNAEFENACESIYEEHWDDVADAFEGRFNYLKVSAYNNKDKINDGITEVVNWKDNLYSLDSIIYSILRQTHAYTDGGETGASKYNVFNGSEDRIPYPLKFNGEIKRPLNFVKGTPYKFYKSSDLLIILQTLIAEHEYSFADRKLEIIYASSIDQEIKRYTEKIKRIERSIKKLSPKKKDDEKIKKEKIKEIEESTRIIEGYKKYLIYLNSQKEKFAINPKLWAKEYIDKLTKKQKILKTQSNLLKRYYLYSENEYDDIEGDAEAHYKNVLKQIDKLEHEIDVIKQYKQVVINKVNQSKPVPFILVKQPYYEDVVASTKPHKDKEFTE